MRASTKILMGVAAVTSLMAMARTISPASVAPNTTVNLLIELSDSAGVPLTGLYTVDSTFGHSGDTYSRDVSLDSSGSGILTFDVEVDDLMPGDVPQQIDHMVIYPAGSPRNLASQDQFFTSATDGSATFLDKVDLGTQLAARVSSTLGSAPLYGQIIFSQAVPFGSRIELEALSSGSLSYSGAGVVEVDDPFAPVNGNSADIYSWESSAAARFVVRTREGYAIGRGLLRRGGGTTVTIESLYETRFDIDSTVYPNAWQIAAFPAAGYGASDAQDLSTLSFISKRRKEAVWYERIHDDPVEVSFDTDGDVVYELWVKNVTATGSSEYILAASKARPQSSGAQTIAFP